MTSTAVATTSSIAIAPKTMTKPNDMMQGSNSNHNKTSLRKMVKNARYLMEKRDESGKRPDQQQQGTTPHFPTISRGNPLQRPAQPRRRSVDCVVTPPSGAGVQLSSSSDHGPRLSVTPLSVTISKSEHHAYSDANHNSFSSVSLGTTLMNTSGHKAKIKSAPMAAASAAPVANYMANAYAQGEDSMTSFQESACSSFSDLTSSQDLNLSADLNFLGNSSVPSLMSTASQATTTPAPIRAHHLQSLATTGLKAKNTRQRNMVDMQEQQQDVVHASWQNAFAGYSSSAGSCCRNSLARNMSSRSMGSLPSQLEVNEDDYMKNDNMGDSLDGSFQFDLDGANANPHNHDASSQTHESDDTPSDRSHKERATTGGINLMVSREALNKMSSARRTAQQRLRQKNAETIPEEELKA